MDAAVIDALRAETPGTAQGIHLNHSGASLPSRRTLGAINDHLSREAINGPMEAAAGSLERIEAGRRTAARLLGAEAEEIAFTTSGSAAFGLAFAALRPLVAGDRVLVGRQEWGGNLATLRHTADRVGARVEVIPCRDDGAVDPEALEAMLDDRVRLVSLTWLPANGGLVNDAAAIGGVTRRAGIPFFVDAGQALGQQPTDVTELGCDVLKGAARKYLRGPRGTAILYVRKGFQPSLTPAFLDVLSGPWEGGRAAIRNDARAFETSEVSVALLLGLASALDEADALGVTGIRKRIRSLTTMLRGALGAIAGVTMTDLGSGEQSGLVSFTVDGRDAADVRTALAIRRIAVAATGSAYTPLDMEARGLTGLVRASVSHLNTEAELDRLVEAVHCIAKGR